MVVQMRGGGLYLFHKDALRHFCSQDSATGLLRIIMDNRTFSGPQFSYNGCLLYTELFHITSYIYSPFAKSPDCILHVKLASREILKTQF